MLGEIIIFEIATQGFRLVKKSLYLLKGKSKDSLLFNI
jgi:hypothetical protein